MRKSEIARKTGETEITLQLNLDGTGQYQIQTGVGFLDHMLTGFARHGSFDLAVQCQGDTWVDDHHTVEDVGICLGQAFAQALGDLRGVERFGHSVLPMDRGTDPGGSGPVRPGDALLGCAHAHGKGGDF